jgi:hypothetical protein
VRPCLALCSITEQVHDDCTLVDGLVDVEKVLARDPSILLCLLPARTVFAHTNNDVQAVVAKVQALTVALRTVADEGKCVILEVFLKLRQHMLQIL